MPFSIASVTARRNGRAASRRSARATHPMRSSRIKRARRKRRELDRQDRGDRRTIPDASARAVPSVVPEIIAQALPPIVRADDDALILLRDTIPGDLLPILAV